MTDTFWSCCWYEDISKGLSIVRVVQGHVEVAVGGEDTN